MVPDVVPLVPLARLVFIVWGFPSLVTPLYHGRPFRLKRLFVAPIAILSRRARICPGLWPIPNQCEPIRAGCRAVAVRAAPVWAGVGGLCFSGTGGKKSRREMGSGEGTLPRDEFVFFAI